MNITIGRNLYDQPNKHRPKLTAKPGLNKEVVELISRTKKEPEWMLKKRLKALELFEQTKMPNWGPSLKELDFNKIIYFIDPNAKESNDWQEVPEEIKQTFEKLGIPKAEREVLAGAGAQFDCLAEDSIIFCSNGYTKIKDVKKDQTVFSYDEKTNSIVPAKVQAVLPKGKQEVFEVKIAGRVIQATANHPFLAMIDDRKPGKLRSRFAKRWIKLQDLSVGDVIAIAKEMPNNKESISLPSPKIKEEVIGRTVNGKKYVINIKNNYTKVKIPTSSSPDLLWFLGLFLGDGYIKKEKGKDKARVNIAIPKSQKQLREELSNVCKTLFGYTLKSKYEHYIAINSTIIARFIKKLGFGGKAHTKKIPSWVFRIPKEEKLAFLGGYLDSDGTVRTGDSKDVIYTSVNYKILAEVKKLSLFCGLQTSKVTTFKSKHPTEKNRMMRGHRLHVTGPTHLIDSRYNFKKKRLVKKKKYRVFNSVEGTTFRSHVSSTVGFAKIESIELIGKRETYDLSIAKYKNFVAEGIVVHNSGMVYHNLQEQLKAQGVIFENMDVALQKYPDLVKKYFMTNCIPITDHKLIMLHAAVWSGGTFIYVPKNVKVDLPLQAYFRMNAQKGGQFEHTLIIVDEGAELHYIEGCSSPRYTQASLHAGCVEIHVMKNAKVRYSSIENWSKNVYNLNTKRALVHENAIMEWVNGNMGSVKTMLYPCSVLVGEGAKTDSLGIAFAGKNQNQDTGTKVIHAAPNTSSTIKSKSISKDGGISSYRGLVHINKNALNASSNIECDALILDDKSVSNTYPTMNVQNSQVDIAHEAKVGKIGDEQIFYLMSRGLTEEQAIQMIVSGFIAPIVRNLPLEYAVELNKLIELEMEGSVG